MEKNNSPRRYTDLEKQELIHQWKESGKSKSAFCKEHSLGYYSFTDWLSGRRKKKNAESSFVSLKLKPVPESNFATLTLKNGTTISFHQRVEAGFILSLLKA